MEFENVIKAASTIEQIRGQAPDLLATYADLVKELEAIPPAGRDYFEVALASVEGQISRRGLEIPSRSEITAWLGAQEQSPTTDASFGGSLRDIARAEVVRNPEISPSQRSAIVNYLEAVDTVDSYDPETTDSREDGLTSLWARVSDIYEPNLRRNGIAVPKTDEEVASLRALVSQ